MINKRLFSFLLFFGFSFAQEKITFTSANPFGFRDIITNLKDFEAQEVYGILKTPDENGPFPLVIGVAGSLDWAEHHLEYMDMYRGMGIATFELQSFASRQVKSTVGSQVEVTTAMMVLDAYRALETLAKLPQIDKDRVAITGWSLGGGVALFSGWLPAIEKITQEVQFAAHLSIYPPCIIEPQILRFTDAPMNILIGELDNWVPAAACKDLVPKMQDAGANIDLTIFPDAHHSFDRMTPITINEKGYKLEDCRFKMSEDGAVLMNFLNIPMTTPLRQKLALALCAERGPTMGGNLQARQASFDLARKFMEKHLLGN